MDGAKSPTDNTPKLQINKQFRVGRREIDVEVFL